MFGFTARMPCTKVLNVNGTLRQQLWLWLACLIAALLVPGAPGVPGSIAFGQDLQAVGDGEHLWIFRPDPFATKVNKGGFVIWHRHLGDTSGRLHRGPRMTGQAKVAPRGMAAGGGRLWFVLESVSKTGSMAVMSVRAVRGPVSGQWLTDSAKSEDSLPNGVSLRALGAADNGAWAIVSVKDVGTLKGIDHPIANEIAEADKKDNQNATPPESSAPFVPVNRLLHLERNQWINKPIPDDWPVGSTCWVVFADSGDRKPLLVAIPPADQSADGLWVFESKNDAWKKTTYPQIDASQPLVPTSLQSQLVVGRRIAAADESSALEIHVDALRPRGAVTLGSLKIEPFSNDHQWALTAVDNRIALLAALPDEKVFMQAMDLHGSTGVAAVLEQQSIPDLGTGATSQILVMVVLVVASIILIAFWRRDPNWNQLELPETMSLGDFGSRAAAGVIDFAIAFVGGMLICRVNYADIMAHWPGYTHSSDLKSMIPGAVVIAVFVLHTMIGEFRSGRTMGKKMMGLSVSNLKGETPSAKQLLLRNVLKALELMAFPLLIVPVMSPNRQRLGDLVARTVVIVGPANPRKVPPKETEVRERDDD